MPHDSAAVDAALLALLEGDATLQAELPDGVYWAEAKAGAKRFVVVDLFDHVDTWVQGGRAIESTLYVVKGVAMSNLAANMRAVERRLDELLDGGVLTVPGYVFMDCARERRIHDTERDDVLTSERWFHRGGFYRINVSIDAAVTTLSAQGKREHAAAPATVPPAA